MGRVAQAAPAVAGAARTAASGAPIAMAAGARTGRLGVPSRSGLPPLARAPGAAPSSLMRRRPEDVLALQRLYGNHAVQRLVAPGGAAAFATAATPGAPAASAPGPASAVATAPASAAPGAVTATHSSGSTPGTGGATQAGGSSPAPGNTGAGATNGTSASTATGAGRDAGTAGLPAHPADGVAAPAAEDATAPGAKAGASARGPAALLAGAADTGGLLAALAGSPASAFAAAVAAARGAAAPLQAAEKQQAAHAVQPIEAPTGMPVAPGARKATPTALALVPAANVPAPGAGRTTPPAPALVASGPVPRSQISTVVHEPAAGADDDGGGWWNWLTSRLGSFFASLPTHDANLSTSAGERQRVDLQGDADPAQNEQEVHAQGASVKAGRGQAEGATGADFGEHAVAPTLAPATLRPAARPGAPKAAGRAVATKAPSLPADEQARFDAEASPWIAEQVAGRQAGYRGEQARYEKASHKAQQDGARDLALENERTRGEQMKLREAAAADVGGARQRWRDENRKIETTYGDKAGARRQEVDREIGTKVETAHRDADIALEAAEKKAQTEKAQAEADAAAKKREEESKPRSAWDRVKGAISDAFDAIRGAVTAIFDKARALVKGIIDTARKAVHALIEVARSAIVGLIHAFGTFLKGLVTIALAAFPEAAAKARAWIDGRVNQATDAVNRAAKVLEQTADAILDGIEQAIDAALDLLQAAFMGALDVLEKLALLPLQAMEALARVVAWMAENGKFLMAAMNTETNGDTLIEGIKNAVGGMIAGVPAQAQAALKQYAGSLGGGAGPEPSAAAKGAGPGTASRAAATLPVQRAPDPAAPTQAHAERHVPASVHLKGVLRHLDKGLDHLKAHWWDELKKVGWNLLWPWPAVWSDLKDIWKEIKAGFDSAYHLQVSKTIDHVLVATQKFNSILGNLYGWFFIASVLIGAIVGAFFGGAGAIPGALAGAAFAGEVGEALVVGLLATEGAVIVKSVADLAIGNASVVEDEEDYGKIGGSTLTIAITLAMMLLGEIAAKLAKSIWEAVAGVFKGEKAPEVKVEVEADPVKGADTPEAKGEAPEVIDGEQVVAHEPTPDGHEVKITEEGRCLICSTCEEIEIRYKDQLEAGTPEAESLKTELAEAKKLPNGEAKAKAIEVLEQKLEALDRAAKAAGGKLIGDLAGLSPEEIQFVREQLAQGKTVEVVPRGAGRTPDFIIDGKRIELKTISGVADTSPDGVSKAIANRVMNGRGQATDITVDARQQIGITQEVAERGIRRAYGADNATGGKITSIRVIGPDFDITISRVTP